MTTATPPKRRILKTVWDAWKGYEAGRYVVTFGNSPTKSAEESANDWLNRIGDETDRSDETAIAGGIRIDGERYPAN